MLHTEQSERHTTKRIVNAKTSHSAEKNSGQHARLPNVLLMQLHLVRSDHRHKRVSYGMILTVQCKKTINN